MPRCCRNLCQSSGSSAGSPASSCFKAPCTRCRHTCAKRWSQHDSIAYSQLQRHLAIPCIPAPNSNNHHPLVCVGTLGTHCVTSLLCFAPGSAAFYSTRTSRCYTCTATKQPRLIEVDGVKQYAPVNCLARCNPNDSVGAYTVILSKTASRRTLKLNNNLSIGNAWIT